MSDGDSEGDGVVELVDDKPSDAVEPTNEKSSTAVSPPFLSQGDIDQDALMPDLSDAKQTRVIIYIVLSLLPVLFLIPLMLTRELIPLEALPPVDMGM